MPRPMIPVLLSLTAFLSATNCDAGTPAAPAVVQETSEANSPKKAELQEKKAAATLPTSASSADAALKQVDDFIAENVTSKKIDKNVPRWRESMPVFPKLKFSEDKNYFWHLRTNKGDVKIRLMPDIAPNHVSSTIYLVRSGFYDDLVFHRVITSFMAQGGCPAGNGRGGPGYKYAGETSPNVKHDRPGLLSMANTGRPSTDGSQFFLTFHPTPWLDGKHTIFGEVVQGLKVLKALEAQGSRNGATKEKLEMQKSTITVEPRKKAKPTAPDQGGGGQ